MSKQESVMDETIKKSSVSRRDFLKAVGAVAVFAEMSSLVKVPVTTDFLKTATAAPAATTDVWLPTVCRMCSTYEAVQVHVVNGQPVKVEGDPADPDTRGHLCAKGNAGIWVHYDPYRVKTPLKRTNPKGPNQTGAWVEISWDEAYNTIANKIAAVRAKGAQGVVNYHPYSALSYSQTWANWIDPAGSPNTQLDLAMNWCGHIGHYIARAAHLAFVSPADINHCNYLIQFGRTHGLQAGCSPFVGRAKRVAEARARGMKIVNFDPRMGEAAAKADEWYPIVPATDGAVASAMLEVLLVELKQYDVTFIKQNTNGPYLIGPDLLYVRDPTTKKPLVWDSVDNKAKTYDDATIKDYAILGTFTANGVTAKPGFQKLVDAVTPMTPEWAQKISDVPAAAIRRIATEFVNAAQIGSTITIGGKVWPYRPAATEYYGGSASNHVHGTANGQSIELLNTVIGAQDAVGGHCNDMSGGPGYIRGGPDGMIEQPVGAYTMTRPAKWPYKWSYPPDASLQAFFPLGDHLGAVTYYVMGNPKLYGGAGNIKIDVQMQHCSNAALSMYDQPKMAQIWSDSGFIGFICLNIEESAEGFADIVLPDRCYLEQYQHLSGRLLQPVTEPPNAIPHVHDMLSEIASRAGFLKDFNTNINSSLKDPYKIPDVTKKVAIEDLMDLVLKSSFGANYGLAWFRDPANTPYKRTETNPTYQPWKTMLNPPRRIPVYFETFQEAVQSIKPKMDANNVQWDYSDYSPVPTWIPSHLHKDTPPYDLIAMPYLTSYHTYTWTNQVPTLAEISLKDPYAQYIQMNPTTAKAKGIKDGDLVYVETAIGKAEARSQAKRGSPP